jgi:hypothetical protein
VHAGRRARFAGQIRRSGGRDEKNAIPFLGDLLNCKGNRGDGNVDDGVDALLIDPLARDIRADIRLVLVISRDDLDLLAEYRRRSPLRPSGSRPPSLSR